MAKNKYKILIVRLLIIIQILVPLSVLISIKIFKTNKEEKLVLNPYYKKAHEEQTECLTYSLADMMRKALAGAC